MKSREFLEERISKAQEFITKKAGTIEKKIKLIEKKRKAIEDLGIQYPDGSEAIRFDELEEMGFDKDTAWKIWWLECDVTHLTEDIDRISRDIKEKQAALEGYEKELQEVTKIEDMIIKEVPEAFKQAEAEIVERWTEHDIKHRDRIIEDYRNLDYKEYARKYSTYECSVLRYMSDEDIRKRNEKDAKAWLVDLYYRVKAVTGKITNAEDLYFAGKALNGRVYGEAGNAIVETIGAGGYNIQRYHLRVLVHKF